VAFSRAYLVLADSLREREAPLRSPPPSGAPKERPRLKLQPRSKPLEAGQTSGSSAIFGGAKPVDTAARERQIEEKLQMKKQHSASEKESRY